MLVTREIIFVNGQDCGSGYDVCAYVSNDGRSAAQVRKIATREEVYVDLTGCEDPESSARMLADGVNVPTSDEGAERLWHRMNMGTALLRAAAGCGE